jgi:hypothetical protein
VNASQAVPTDKGEREKKSENKKGFISESKNEPESTHQAH